MILRTARSKISMDPSIGLASPHAPDWKIQEENVAGDIDVVQITRAAAGRSSHEICYLILHAAWRYQYLMIPSTDTDRTD